MRGARSHQVVREEGTLQREAKRRGRTLSWPKGAKTQRSCNGWRQPAGCKWQEGKRACGFGGGLLGPSIDYKLE